MSGIRKISSFKRKTSLERVPVLPIHEKYAERVQNDLDPFDDIIGKIFNLIFWLPDYKGQLILKCSFGVFKSTKNFDQSDAIFLMS